jgi:hypothetical protein
MRSGAGGNEVQAYSVGYDGTAVFTATGTQGSSSLIVVDSGNAQISAVNQPLPKSFIAVVTDAGHNRLANVPVTFTVKKGGGSFDGNPSVTLNTDSDGRAAAILMLGGEEGNENNLVEANFPGNQGFPVSFTASGRVPQDPAQTQISGVVLDNSNIPIPGVTMRAVQTEALTANAASVANATAVQTDPEGQFSIQPAPVGHVKLMVDGSTAQRPGTYPTLEYDMVTTAGLNNTLGMPIYLLPLNEQNKLCVTETNGGGTLTIPEAPGFSLTFGPSQVTFPGGSKSGCISVTVVHADKVPMVPGFGQQPRFIVTIQPVGAHFDPPAPITLPNVDGLKAGQVTEMYSFDHDIGSFVAIGTGTVSNDGMVIRSNPGVGVLKAGWHCGGNPSANGTVADCGVCNLCISNTCVIDDLQLPPQNSPSDCNREVCVGGQVRSVPDDSEVVTQTSLGDCREEICSGGHIDLAVDETDSPAEELCCGINAYAPSSSCCVGGPEWYTKSVKQKSEPAPLGVCPNRTCPTPPRPINTNGCGPAELVAHIPGGWLIPDCINRWDSGLMNFIVNTFGVTCPAVARNVPIPICFTVGV